jgi:enterochelin esterase-like enzyme
MSLKTVSFSSAALRATATLNVLVPDGDLRYPVLYLHHGLGDTFETFCRATEIEQYVGNLDLIVAMPDARDSWFCNDPRPAGLAWEDHLAVELVDFVDSAFPTIPDRGARGLAGFSMGGYGAMMLGLNHTDRFSTISTHAGSFAFGHALRADRPERSDFMRAVAPPGGKYDLWEIARKLTTKTQRVAIRCDVGTNDHLLRYNRDLHARLKELGVDHEYEEVAGGHEWDYVNRRLPVTLAFMTKHLSKAH